MAGFKWNIKGFEEIRRSPEIQAEVEALAQGLADEAGRGFVTSSMQGKSRFRAIVFAGDSRAYGAQLRSNVLQKVLFARKGAG